MTKTLKAKAIIEAEEEEFFDDKEEVLDLLQHKFRYIAKFYPCKEMNGKIHVVSAEGPDSWDVTNFVGTLSPQERTHLSRHITPNIVLDDDENTDILRHDPAAPKWIRNWPGPYQIMVHAK